MMSEDMACGGINADTIGKDNTFILKQQAKCENYSLCYRFFATGK